MTDGQLQSAEAEELQRRQHIEKILANSRQYEQLIQALKQELEVAAADIDITEFYPQFVVENDYIQDREKGIMEEEISILLERLEGENRQLKNQLRAWSHQFGKKARLSEQMLKENGLLRQQLIQKDKDLIQLVDSMACGYGKDMQLLQHRMHQLTEENNLLQQHLEKTTDIISDLKQQQREMAKLLEDADKKQREQKYVMAKILDEQDHLTKLSVMKASTIENLQRKVQKARSQQGWRKQINDQLKKDEEQLQGYLVDSKPEISDIRKNIIKENDDKGNQERELRKNLHNFQREILSLTNKERDLEVNIKRNENNLIEFENILRGSQQKLKVESPEINDSDTKLQKQLEKEANKAVELTLLNDELSKIEWKINNIVESQKRQEKEQPKKIKQLEQHQQGEKKRLEREIVELEKKHSTDLLNLNSDVNRYRSELEKLQLQLNGKIQDIHDVRLKIEQARLNKQNLRGLNATIKSKTAQLQSLKASRA